MHQPRAPALSSAEHAELAFRVVELKLMYPGLKVWMTKRDIEGAFKRAWLALDEVEKRRDAPLAAVARAHVQRNDRPLPPSRERRW